MRLFIAICLNDALRGSLVEMQKQAESLGAGGKLTPRENMHLTLAFIGEYGRPGDVLDVMRSVTVDPFEIEICGAGHFGEILWAGVKCPDSLKKYVAALRKKLGDSGIPFDAKLFNPHITLARKIVKMPEGLMPQSTKMTVKKISLMRSDRNRFGQMEYREIGSVTCL